MKRLKIKPFSNNDMWKGRKFKTKAYKAFISDVFNLLPKRKLPKFPKKTKLFAHYRWGFSSSLSDIDNPVKPFEDSLFERMINDDRDVYFTILEKRIVPKKEEYIEFHVDSTENLIEYLELLVEHLKRNVS